MVYFPQNIKPTWIDHVNLPAKPNIPQRFQMGVDSDLRLSSIPIDGKIKCEFHLSPTQAQDVKDFWAVVEMADSFQFKESFWPESEDPAAVQGFKGYSPTGFWRFDAQPTFEMDASQYSTVVIVFRGAIL